MRVAARLLLLIILLLLITAVVVKVRDRRGGRVPPASLTARGTDVETVGSASRLSRQPMVLRAKPLTSDTDRDAASSPRYWEGSPAVTPPGEPPADRLFPTGQTLVDPGWFGLDRSTSAAPVPASNTGTASGESTPPDTDGPPPLDGLARDRDGILAGPEDAAGVVSPERPHSDRIVTESDDSFWSISQRVYGSGAYFKALYQHNRGQVVRPDRIEGGVEILTPPAAELHQLYPDLCPRIEGDDSRKQT